MMYNLNNKVEFVLNQIRNDYKKENYIAIVMRKNFYNLLKEYLQHCYVGVTPPLIGLFGLSVIVDDDVVDKFGYDDIECVCLTKEGMDIVVSYINNKNKKEKE